MAKFQAKYAIQIDRDDAERKALAFGYDVRRGGGRPELGQAEDAGAQVVIRIPRPEATVQISANRILVWWAGPYEKINEIENFLEAMLKLKSNIPLKELRISVPSIHEERLRAEVLSEQMNLERGIGEQNVKIKELQTLLEIVEEKSKQYREMGIEPVGIQPNDEDVVKRAKKLLSMP